MSVREHARAESSRGNTPGRNSLVLGTLAIVGQFIPVVGGFLAGPIGLIAVVLGAVGLRRVEQGTATNFVQSLAGLALGAFAVLIILFFLVAIR